MTVFAGRSRLGGAWAFKDSEALPGAGFLPVRQLFSEVREGINLADVISGLLSRKARINNRRQDRRRSPEVANFGWVVNDTQVR